jgi:hypothetical protein
MYAVRFRILPLFKLNIHNQCSNIDLLSPEYVTGYKTECYKAPSYEVGAGNTMNSGFVIYDPSDESGGTLIYRLQRKQSYESTEISEDASRSAHLLVAWSMPGLKKLYADVLLVEHEEGFDWDKDDLKCLYRENFDRFRFFLDSATETWSLNNNAALMTTFEIMNKGQILDVTISEVKRDNGTRIPAQVDLKR